MLKIEQLQLGYDDKVILENINFSIELNEIVAVLGASGSGKTTLLKGITGLIPIQSGHIELAGKDISQMPVHRRNIGVVFQDLRLFPHLTVYENIAFPMKMQKISSKETINQQVEKLLDQVQLLDYKHRSIKELSGGQQQRIALARALAGNPDLLLLDEPFSSLDEPLRIEMRQLLKQLHQTWNIPMLLVTHDKDEAVEISHRIVFLNQQSIYQTGAPLNLINRPRDAYVAHFFGEINELPGKIKNEQFSSVLGDFAAPSFSDGNFILMKRPNEIFITDQPGDWEITDRILQTSHLRLDLKHPEGLAWTVYVDQEATYQVGDQVDIAFINQKHWYYPMSKEG